MLKADSRQTTASNALIDEILRTTLDKASRAAAVSVTITGDVPMSCPHGVPYYGTDIGGQQATEHGHDLMTNQWSRQVGGQGRAAPCNALRCRLLPGQDLMRLLAPGTRCASYQTDHIRDQDIRDRLDALNITHVLLCPAIDPSGHRVGAMLVVWTGHDQPPDTAERAGLEATCLRAARQIAAIFGLCSPAASPQQVAA
jgi:hypothetical protein